MPLRPPLTGRGRTLSAMGRNGFTVRLDPWAAGYESASSSSNRTKRRRARSTRRSRQGLAAIRPGAGRAPASMAFVDGVRRIEHRLLLESRPADRVRPARLLRGGRHAHGRTGARGTRTGGARGLRRRGSGLQPAGSAGAGGKMTSCSPPDDPENTPVAPVQCLQNSMRGRRPSWGGAGGRRGGLVFLDGPLTFLAESPAGGGLREAAAEAVPATAGSGVLRRLGTGERTPVFLISSRAPRYSWYLRLARGGPIDSSLAGMVRLETSGAAGSGGRAGAGRHQRARAAALRLQPRARPAGTPEPLPIGGLESGSSHLLGDHLVVRRAIESRLHQAAWS